jgi:hypothetical protein
MFKASNVNGTSEKNSSLFIPPVALGMYVSVLADKITVNLLKKAFMKKFKLIWTIVQLI